MTALDSVEARALEVLSDPVDPEWISRMQSDRVITSWGRQKTGTPRVIAGGEGSWFWDSDGNRFLDFESQLVNLNLGHQHPRLVAEIQRQAEELCYAGPSMAVEARSRLAAALAALTPGNLERTFFTNGGAEATENAVRLARRFTGREKIITRYRSYHGATHGSLSASGDPRRWGASPEASGVVRVFDPYTYRCPAGHPDSCPVCSGAPHIEEVLQYENPSQVAAIMLETITGTNGIIDPPDGYLQSIRELCDRYGILLILDEVMVGFGRTGRWFACDHWDVVPDILCLAKGINSGYVPLGAMVVSDEIGVWLDDNTFPGGLTYSGHPLACASGVAALRVMIDEDVVANASRRGSQLREGLEALAERHPVVGEVRGVGLMQGLELVSDRETRDPLVPFNAKGPDALPVKNMLSAGMERGLYLSAFSNVMRIAPPLVITEDEIDLGLDILDEVLAVGDGYVVG